MLLSVIITVTQLFRVGTWESGNKTPSKTSRISYWFLGDWTHYSLFIRQRSALEWAIDHCHKQQVFSQQWQGYTSKFAPIIYWGVWRNVSFWYGKVSRRIRVYFYFAQLNFHVFMLPTKKKKKIRLCLHSLGCHAQCPSCETRLNKFSQCETALCMSRWLQSTRRNTVPLSTEARVHELPALLQNRCTVFVSAQCWGLLCLLIYSSKTLHFKLKCKQK